MVEVILRSVVLIAVLFVLVLIGFIMGVIVDPIYEEIIGRQAIVALGFDSGLDLTWEIGLTLSLPLLGLGVIIWAHIAELKNDVGMRRR